MNSAISPNTTIAQYTILSKIGEGGMGEVWRARDNQIGRDVAIKFLPDALSSDETRLRRFEQEAQAAGALNHPNILVIHHIGTHGGAPYIVSELLEGQTLRERVNGSSLPQRKAIDYALQTARGLSAAHAKGITHRDLKPENLFITGDGRIKILDFGLAKLTLNLNEVKTDAPTRKVNTDPGTVMGTVGYMSPEQLKGAPADHRSDIFSFGAILYEMLSGKRAFHRESAAETMSAILREDPPDLSATNKLISPALERVVDHCLEKNPDERFQSARDLAFALEALSGATTQSDQTLQITPEPALIPRVHKATVWIITAAVMTLTTLALLFLYLRRPAANRADTSVIRVVQQIPINQVPSGQSRDRLALSPDGTKLVYAANRRLYLRSLDNLEAVEVRGTEGATNPFFSPDGKWLGFLIAAGQVKKVAVTGGTPEPLCVANIVGASWGPDDRILLGAMFSGILLFTPNTGKTTTLVAPKPSISYTGPQFLPDGRSFIYTRGRAGNAENEVVIRSLDKDDETVLLTGGYSYQYHKSGYIIFSQPAGPQRVDFAVVPLDLAARKTIGNPVVVLRGVQMTTAASSSHFAISDTGTLAYMPVQNTEAPGTRLVSSDRQGKSSPLPTELRDYSDPRVSPDGRYVAVHLQDAQNDIWIADGARGTLTRLSYNNGEDETPAWSPDGRTVVWAASTSEIARAIFRRPIDGSRGPELIWKLDQHLHVRDWTPDGRSLILEILNPATSSDIWRLDLQGEPTATPFIQSQFNERNSRISPDGHWLAYVSDESGRDEIYVQSFPESGSKLQVTTAGGDQPVWSRNGRSIIIRRDGLIEEIPFHTGTTPSVGSASTLFPDRYLSPQAGGHTGYDVFPDGRLLMIQASDPHTTAPEQIVLVFNWIEELRRTVPNGK